jgi:uncharacterized membrane protein
MKAAALVLFYIFFPVFILSLTNRIRFFNKIGPVVTAYTFGMIIGNIGIFPMIKGSALVQEMLTMITVPLAIPLLLFSMDLKKWSRMAGKTMLSMLLALVAVISAIVAGFYLFRGYGTAKFWDVSAMLTGLYIGSTPNLASVKIALGADETQFMLVAAYDLLVGAFHLLFVMTIAQRLFLLYLPKYKPLDDGTAPHTSKYSSDEPYFGLNNRRLVSPLLKGLLVSALIFGVGGAVSLVLPKSVQMATVILIITSLGIAASLIPSINKLEKSFDFGMYLILIFSLVISSMADLSKVDFNSLIICAYVVFVVFGSMLIQSLLSRFYKIDADTFLITSTAFICNPAIVPVVAGAIKNREVIFSGLVVSIIGLGIGNYLGVLVAWVLERF